MKKTALLFIFLAFIFAACGSDDEEETNVNDNENENTENPDDSLPDVIIDNGQETPDEDAEETPESVCYAGGALLYEGDSQFKLCSGDSGKFQKQLCKNGKWVDEGECVSGSVTIAAGSFKMGCDKDVEGNCPEDAEPVHEVALSSYAMDKFEVPVELFELCIAENVCTNDDPEKPHYRTSSDSYQCNIGNPERKNHPANCVTWYGAKAYCEWLGKRLPTEAEWENAAKSGKVQIYPWGNTPAASCDNTVMKGSANGCGSNTTSPIGSKAAGVSEQGIFDLSGNVSEYTGDWYEKKFYSTEEASKADPLGPDEPEKDKFKVFRGGSYIYGENHTRSSFRGSAKLDAMDTDFGFRCVK
ncbi:formylglycine-generating enzyme family protein [bacterium]|nr:formylglycine-generating enzyme family protein [bacterium]MBQ4437359.1 formylglycine-generating enzyme family protein [bacterium]